MMDRTLPVWMSIERNRGTMEKDKQGFLKKNILEDDLPFLEFSGAVIYSREKNDCSFLSEDLRSCLEPGAAVGFDIEWPPSFFKGKTKKVAMVQLCAFEGKCYLFHLSSMSGFPSGLKMLLQDEAIKKVGVGIEGDMWKMLSDFDIKLKNYVELSNLANETLRCSEKWSLDGLVKHLLKRQLMKDKDVRCSQWDDFELTEDQKRYAATDAYAGLMIYNKLQEMASAGSTSHLTVKEKLLQMANELKQLAEHIPEGGRDINSAADVVDDMTVNLETLRSLLLGNSTEMHTAVAADLPNEGTSEEKEDLERSSEDLLNLPENGHDLMDQVRLPERCSSAHEDGAWMSLDISEYELQMLEAQARREELEEQSTLEFQEKKPLDDSSDLSYVVESDEELENEMLQCVEEVEKMTRGEKDPHRGRQEDPRSRPAIIDDDEDDEDEGIEEEAEEVFDPSLPEPTPEQINCLKTYFGHFRFKPVQWKVIYSVLKERRDNLVVMATGYGKSLCFQFPPVYCGGVSVVVSPLISLMEDQVLQLKMSNIPACFLGSAQTSDIIPDLKKGHFRVAYMTPEFCSGRISLLEEINEGIGLTLIAIDEAHCISEWGHDFRGAYRNLGLLKKKLPQVPIVALTATASPSIRVDIVQSLRLVQPVVTCTTFDRPNLYLDVHRKSGDIIQDLKQFLVKKKNGEYEFEGPAIVYCPSRKEAERVSAALCKLDILCGLYHAGLGVKQRRETQHRFMRDEIQCIAATIAFGMGINKADIRKVIHYGAPKEMESYYQEIGRAGRDGLPSACHVLWTAGDMSLNKFLLKQGKNNRFRGYKMKMLAKMEQYLKSNKCRRKLILSHFEDKQLRKVTTGIMGTDECCDNCRNGGKKDLNVEEPEPRLQNFGNEAHQLMSAISALDEKFGMLVPILFLRGSGSQRVPDKYRRHQLFGAGRNVSEAWWKALAQVLLLEEYLKESTGHSRFSTLCQLTPKGKKWLRSAEDEAQRSLLLQPSPDLCARVSVPVRVHIPSSPASVTPLQKPQLDKYSRPETSKYVRSADVPSPRHRAGPSLPLPAAKPAPPTISPRELELQVELYGKLVAGRQKLASEKDIPPAILATNKILLDMAKIRPCTQASLKLVDGVSEAKSKMLEPLLRLISEFCRSHGLQADVSPKTADPRASGSGSTETAFPPSLGSGAITYRLFQEEGKSLRMVSDSRSLPLAVVECHLLQARRAGLPLDTERAGLTSSIRCTIANTIKGHPISSDLNSIKAIRALVPEHISTFLIQLAVMELERQDEPSTTPVTQSSSLWSPPAVHQPAEITWIEPKDKPAQRSERPAISSKEQASPDAEGIEMMEDELFSLVPMPKGFDVDSSAAPCSSQVVTAAKPASSDSAVELDSRNQDVAVDALSWSSRTTSQEMSVKANEAPRSSVEVPAPKSSGIELASWNKEEFDRDTQDLFSDSPAQNVNQPVKRKLPEWAALPRGSASTSTGTKLAKKKKGLFL
ncbi:hypothetical protein GJAV_G00042690 [Gymnothorax javanicus]|nr:hypothetical protein GJAV_G00042690 [Gymnothorax javanicus]